MMKMLFTTFCLIGLALGNGFAATLAEHSFSRVGPEFLLSLKVSEELRNTLAQQIEQLGADDFRERQKAERALFAQPIVPVDLLDNAEADDNPERAIAVRRLRDHMLLNIEESMNRAFGEIRKERMTGWVDEVLYAMRFCRDSDTYYLAELCLSTTTQESDFPTLISALESKFRFERQLAAATLIKSEHPKRFDLTAPVMQSGKAEMKLYLANLFLEAGDARGLPMLIELAESGSQEQQMVAGAILKRVAGEKAQSINSVEDWRTWAASDGAADLKASLEGAGRLHVEPGLVADFAFVNAAVNEINNTPAVTRNVQLLGNAMKLTGNFGAAKANDTHYHFSTDVPGPWKGDGLTLALDFKPQLTPGTNMSLLRLGTELANITIMIDQNGMIFYSFRTARSNIRTSMGQRVQLGQVNHLTVTIDAKGKNLLTRINQLPPRSLGIDRYQPGEDEMYSNQALSISLAPRPGYQSFNGEIHTLKLFNRPMDRDALDALHDGRVEGTRGP